MKARVRYEEHTYREALIEVESLDAVRTQWKTGYHSVIVDAIEEASVEIDGGIVWDSVTVEEVK
jgi:hypothetical protein